MRYIVELNPRQSARVLDQCVRAGSQLLVELAGNMVRPEGGRFVSADESILLVSLDQRLKDEGGGLVGRYVDVQVFTEPRHCFTTHIVQTGSADEPNQIALKRPDILQVVQRRRSWRTHLAPSSTVQLRWNGPDGNALAQEGTVLNMSADGLACRMTDAAASEIYVGDHIDVCFELPVSATQFQFAATITNRTPASDEGIILGVQFLVTDDDDDRAVELQRELRDCLYASNHEFHHSSTST